MEEDITSNLHAVALVEEALDTLSPLIAKAKHTLLEVLEKHQGDHATQEPFATIDFFLNHYRKDWEPEDLSLILPYNDPAKLTNAVMVEHFGMRRFGSFYEAAEEQHFIMDLSYNPEYMDELMVIVFKTSHNLLRTKANRLQNNRSSACLTQKTPLQ